MQTALKTPATPPPVATEGFAQRVAQWRYLGVSAFLFAFLQAICPALVALGAVRIFLGAGALALAASAVPVLKAWHTDAIRIPMDLLAFLGAGLNLFVIWQIRRLRARPAAQWRVTPPSAATLRSERWQILLSVLALVCLAIEEGMHIYLHSL